MSVSNTTNDNPLLEINTSFRAYLDARTRTYTDHIISGGRLDYSFDGDFAARSKINTIPGWSKMYKTITTQDIPAMFKRLFQSCDVASSVLYPAAFKAAAVCSERMQLSVLPVFVKKAKDKPEIFSLAGEGIETCIVMSSDIAEMCTPQELNYLIGCEFGRLQNKHAAYNFAFTYPGIRRGSTGENLAASETRELNYNLNAWILPADMTADRAGIICLDVPSDFAKIYLSVRSKLIPDSFGDVNTSLSLDEILDKYDEFNMTPVRALVVGDNYSRDEKRIFSGLEFASCEVLYNWRPDLDKTSVHLTNKQAIEIRCELLAGMDRFAEV